MSRKKLEDSATSTALAAAPYEKAPEPWITSKMAARHLGISNITLRRWVKDGRLTPKRTPTGEFRFRRSELDSVLA